MPIGKAYPENPPTSVVGECQELTPYTKLPKCGGDLLKHKYKSKAIDISLVMARDIEVTEGEEIE